MTADRRILWLLRLLLAVLIFGLLFRAIGQDRFVRAFAQTDWRWLFPLYATAALAILVNARLLQYLLRRAGLAVRLRRVLLAKSLGSFYALILPGDLFAGAAKWADLSAATGNRADVLSSLVLAKVALALPPLVAGSVALAIGNPLQEPSLAIAVAALAIVVLSVTGLMLHPRTARSLDIAAAALLRRAPPLLRSPGERLLRSLVLFQGLPPAAYARVLAFSVSVFGLAILGMYFATVAAGVSVPLAVLLWVSLVLFVTRMLPLTVGNLGVRESVLAVAFGLYGVPPASAVLVGLLMFSSMLFMGLLGGAYQVAIASGWVRWRSGADVR